MRYCSQSSVVQRHLARISYRVYLVHFAVVSCVQFAFLRMPNLSPCFTLFGTIVVSLALTYLFAAALMLPARWYARLTKSHVPSDQAIAAQQELVTAG